MPMENAKEFMKKVREDESLKERVCAEIEL